MSLYYSRRIVYFLTDVEIFVVTDVPEDVTAVPVVTHRAYVLRDVMVSMCISNFGLRTAM